MKSLVYLQLDKDNFYYFNYKKGLLTTFSSNEEFNKTISETKKDRDQKQEKRKARLSIRFRCSQRM